MISGRQGCRFRFFVKADEVSQEAGCDEYLVISPREREATYPWMWNDFGFYFSSLADFEANIADIQEKKAAYIRSLSNEESDPGLKSANSPQ